MKSKLVVLSAMCLLGASACAHHAAPHVQGGSSLPPSTESSANAASASNNFKIPESLKNREYLDAYTARDAFSAKSKAAALPMRSGG